jgi:hypothetical protein
LLFEAELLGARISDSVSADRHWTTRKNKKAKAKRKEKAKGKAK